MSSPGKRQRFPLVPAHRPRQRRAAGSGQAGQLLERARTLAGGRGRRQECSSPLSQPPPRETRGVPSNLHRPPGIPDGCSRSGDGMAEESHGRTPGCRIQHPRSCPLPLSRGRVNISVQGAGSFHWRGGFREGGSFTPFPPGNLAEPCSWKLFRVCFPNGLVCVVTSELRAPFVLDRDLKATCL